MKEATLIKLCTPRRTFTLLEFASVILDTGGYPSHPRTTACSERNAVKGPPLWKLAEYNTLSPLHPTTTWRTFASPESLSRTTAWTLNITSTAVLVVAIAKTDLVLSLVPDSYHTDVIRFAVRDKTGVVTTSYVRLALFALDDLNERPRDPPHICRQDHQRNS
ncbi:hypothetical protein BU17DRAFT_85822 [Hysterangium stoloniferum]|nr:hypothetical protein BU17DRAFT_85822 [Hysterangium stoloniferum]